MNHDEINLPKWAQIEMQRLRANLAKAETALAIARQEAPQNGATGKVMVELLMDGFPVNDRAHVTFKLANGNSVTCMIQDEYNGQVLDINSRGTMQILPRASNSAYVRIEN